MKIIQVDGYELWASYFINGDASGLSGDDLTEIAEFLALNDLNVAYCLDCSDEPFFGSPDFDGLKGTLLTYTFSVKN